jgi:hypothetical protein
VEASVPSKLSGCESTLECSLYKALRELKRLQAARRADGNASPPRGDRRGRLRRFLKMSTREMGFVNRDCDDEPSVFAATQTVGSALLIVAGGWIAWSLVRQPSSQLGAEAQPRVR